ncbi:MAG: HAMP domain-containing protein, partial [Bdellovibrionota bacterium]
MSTHLPAISGEPQRSALRIPIATKFLALIAAMILIALSSVIFNATRIFQADNLDTVSLSADLLTAAKSGQVRAWGEAVLSRSQYVLDTIGTTRKPPADEEILYARITGPEGAAPVQEWLNADLLKTLGIDPASELPTELKKAIHGGSPSASAVELRPWKHPSGRPVIVLIKPLSEKRIAVIAISTTPLERMFGSSGPYTFMLLNSRGDVLAHKELERVGRRENIDDIPVIKRVVSSEMDRALQEFNYEGAPTLGTYAKVGFSGLGVLNLVSRSTALETGDTLIRRSVLIGLLIFLLAFVVSHLFTETIVSPVLKLRGAAQSISSGNYGSRVAVKTRDEIFDLATSFNKMCDEISRRIETLARINQIAVQVRTIKDPQQILDLAVETFTLLFGFASAVGVYREKGDGMEPNTFTSGHHWSDGKLLKMMGGLLSQTKSPQWISVGDSGALLCPILHQQEARGFVVLAGRKDSAKLSEEELSLAQTILSIFTAEFENASFSRELQAINADLELRVEQRTAELSTANQSLTVAKKEVDDVMNNIQQGILTFGADGVINQEHSKFALDIFVNQQLAGAD